MNYYLDIETTGLDELHDKIITIQYMELERNTGKPIGINAHCFSGSKSSRNRLRIVFSSDSHSFNIFNGPTGFPVFLSSYIY